METFELNEENRLDFQMTFRSSIQLEYILIQSDRTESFARFISTQSI